MILPTLCADASKNYYIILLLIKQHSSVKLVLTTNSITRYDKISEDKEFAEYYFLGTLLSTVCLLIISII